MAIELTNVDVNPPLLEQQYQTQVQQTFTQQITEGTTIITTINGGGGGNANGPNVTLTGGVTGYQFQGGGSTLTMVVSDAAVVRAAISAAKSGVNSDITAFTALTGNTGISPWSGSANGGPFATFSGTASVGYVQAELQATMDAVQDATEFLMALTAALLAWGGVET